MVINKSKSSCRIHREIYQDCGYPIEKFGRICRDVCIINRSFSSLIKKLFRQETINDVVNLLKEEFKDCDVPTIDLAVSLFVLSITIFLFLIVIAYYDTHHIRTKNYVTDPVILYSWKLVNSPVSYFYYYY